MEILNTMKQGFSLLESKFDKLLSKLNYIVLYYSHVSLQCIIVKHQKSFIYYINFIVKKKKFIFVQSL